MEKDLSGKNRSETPLVLNFTKAMTHLFFGYSSEVFATSVDSATNQASILDFYYTDKVRLLLASIKTTGSGEKVLEFSHSPSQIRVDNNHVIVMFKRAEYKSTEIQTRANYLKSTLSVINLGVVRDDFNLTTVFAECVKNSLIPLFRDINQRKHQTTKSSAGDSIAVITKILNTLDANLNQGVEGGDMPRLKLEFDEAVKSACAVNGVEPTVEAIPKHLLEDRRYVDEIAEQMNRWVRESEIMLNLGQDGKMESVESEVGMWRQVVESLKDVKRQFELPEVKLTINVLQHKKRMNMTNMESIRDFEKKMRPIEQIEQATRGLNFEQMMRASDYQELGNEVTHMFDQVRLLVVNNAYNKYRLKSLLELLNKEYWHKIIKLMNKMQMLEMDFGHLSDTISKLKTSNFNKWEMNLEQSYERIRMVRRMEIVDFQKFRDKKNALYRRFDRLLMIRSSYEGVLGTFSKSAQTSNRDFPTARQVTQAFEIFNKVELFDLTAAGSKTLDEAMSRYEKTISVLEKATSASIKALFEAEQTGSDKFKLYRRLAPFFKRECIRNELTTVHESLTAIIEEEQKRLIEKFKGASKQLAGDKQALASRLNMPRPIYRYVWTKQLIKAMQTNLDKIRLIADQNEVGETKSRELSQIGESFVQQVTKSLEDNYTELERQYSSKEDDRIIEVRASNEAKDLMLTVNFKNEDKQEAKDLMLTVNFKNEDKQVIKSMKYFYLLKQELNKKYYLKYIFTTINLKAYTLSYYIKEYIGRFNGLTLDATQTSLLSKYLRDCYSRIESSADMKWYVEENAATNSKIEKFTYQLATEVQSLETNAKYIKESIARIDALLISLNGEEEDDISLTLKRIQVICTEFEQKSYRNLKMYIESLNDKIKTILATRLESALTDWSARFDNRMYILGGKSSFTCEIKVENESVFIDPSLENIKQYFLVQLQIIVAEYCALSRIVMKGVSERSDFGDLLDGGSERRDFGDLLDRIDTRKLTAAYMTISNQVNNISRVVEEWQKFQGLWEIDVEKIRTIVGIDTSQWEVILHRMIEEKNSLERKENSVCFGTISVSTKTCKKKIVNKYNGLHREMLNYFAKSLNGGMKAMLATMHQKREQVEAVDLEESNDLINSITVLNQCEEQMEGWRGEMRRLESGEKLLCEQYYSFAANWKYFSQVDAEWRRFAHSYEAKQTAYRNNFESIKGRLLRDEGVLTAKISEIEAAWQNKKPYSGHLHPHQALEILECLEKMLGESHAKLKKLNSTKALLNLRMVDLTKIKIIEEECQLLAELWRAMQACWTGVDEICKTPLKTLIPTKLNSALDSIVVQLESLPKKFSSYEALATKKKQIANLKRTSKFLTEVKNEAVKEQHWGTILTKIKLPKMYRNVTFGDLHEHSIEAYKDTIMEIVSVARGEQVLEGMIKKMQSYWNSTEFELRRYKDKCMLIGGWEDMLTKLDDDLGQIASMRTSQHFKHFEDEINEFNGKLLQAQNSLMIWASVQRKWVYLEGIFVGASDIAQQLPNEFARFRSVDNDFTSLMKKASTRLRVLEVIQNIPSLQKSLQLLLDTLEKIQRALSEYLETQRQYFARFYFVGDEDLLEIIGNCKEATGVQSFFAKMFAGINYVETTDNSTRVTGMRSRENESVEFDESFSITAKPRVYEWLAELETRMQKSLLVSIKTALKDWAVADANHSSTVANESSTVAKSTVTNHSSAVTNHSSTVPSQSLKKIVDKYPAQAILVSFQVFWTYMTQTTGHDALAFTMRQLEHLANIVLAEVPKLTRSKYEQLITELVHKRDVSRSIGTVSNALTSFSWSSKMRFYDQEAENTIVVRMGNASFNYGLEYLGVAERLVQTPLTDKCFFTLTQALLMRMGGAPFGPAGTGKTETVKALGNTLGRFVLVFNCDEAFNFKAMSRIFIGLCQVGAWGCFDEFNRLEERILSAVSQQILTIQTSLRENTTHIKIISREVRLNANMGIFVTMNPGYAGRSNLPENLKQLFRQVAMIRPDKQLIAQVMLFSQGFSGAEKLSSKVVSLFELCEAQLSSQPHYDFGLRALKSVLNSAGNMKRATLKTEIDKLEMVEEQIDKQKIVEQENDRQEIDEQKVDELKTVEKKVDELKTDPLDTTTLNTTAQNTTAQNTTTLNTTAQNTTAQNTTTQRIDEQRIILCSFCDTVIPKLVAEDVAVLDSLIKGVFPRANMERVKESRLSQAIEKECDRQGLLATTEFIEKIFQLNQILKLQHGVMLVGATGAGKTATWKILLSALLSAEGGKGESYVIDPKSISKEELYGKLDVTTMEWTDGVFTSILRRVSEASRQETQKRHWIVFDGDVDPEWAENLNSVLDDNKMLTLPNGERIQIASNIKIMFEVETLKFATLATVSRCGMVWFSRNVIGCVEMIYNYTHRLKEDDYDHMSSRSNNEIRGKCVNELEPLLLAKQGKKSFVHEAIELARSKDHVMEFSDIRVIEAFFALVRRGIDRVVEYNEANQDFAIEEVVYRKYMRKWMLLSVQWALAGSVNLAQRHTYFKELMANKSMFELPSMSAEGTLIDYTVHLKTGEWTAWSKQVPESSPDNSSSSDTIITTTDTLRHQEFLCSYLHLKRPFIICGPPGSGKTMTMMSTLRNMPDYELVFVNFSSATTPELILKHLEHSCEYVKTNTHTILRPRHLTKKLVLFCDEINLPDEDKYGTQKVITFMRQVIEQRGFWRSSDKQWVVVERVQFVGACNPPTDNGRHVLSARMMRHCPLLLIDFPGRESLEQIYGSFNRTMLAKNPQLRDHWKELTVAMVEYYRECQQRFTAEMQPHYIYSPRELTRWRYAINEVIDSLDSVADLIQLWGHEALRLFGDRLVTEEEKGWCEKLVSKVTRQIFKNQSNPLNSTAAPLIYSTYLSKHYAQTSIEELRAYIRAKLQVFNEEKYAISLVVFDGVVEHVARIDRVLRQPIGHMLLVGASGVGKTTLSKFVAWMNGLSVYQIRAGRGYALSDFDANLREVMRRAGCKGEKICFIFDESNILSSSFMERMNALLASGEIPGLFEDEEMTQLLNVFRENNASMNACLDDEVYAAFTRNVQRNLHIVFTMNPAGGDFSNRAASSPAIFNRCVIDWFGDWSEEALYQVARELTDKIDMSASSLEDAAHDILVQLIVRIHLHVTSLNGQLRARRRRSNHITPRDFLDFIRHLTKLHNEKTEQLMKQKQHLNNGLERLRETEESVSTLTISLNQFQETLNKSKREADEKMELIGRQVKVTEEQETNLKTLRTHLKKKQGEIEAQSAMIQKDLAKAGPALEEARKAVSGISAHDINQLKALNNPPKLIKMTMTAVCYVLKQVESVEWKDIQVMMRAKDFIGEVLNLNIDSIKEPLLSTIYKKYIGTEDWNIANIQRSYTAAGILASWLESQLAYHKILQQVNPIQAKVKTLQEELDILITKQQTNEKDLESATETIERYKNDYTKLITRVENIKTDIKQLNAKVAKSSHLLSNLASEKKRWSESSQGFTEQLKNMSGDVLASAAFLAYGGAFDQSQRSQFKHTVRKYMEEAGLEYTQSMTMIAYLSTPNERMEFQRHKLPNDDLCSENAIVIARHNRYPLILDPSHQAAEYMSRHKPEKTSFEQVTFYKQLEKCLRFGLPLLILGVKKVDAMLNGVLNGEIVKQGGRNLVRLGDQEIDFNENFRLYMISSDEETVFPPDVCSRVTLVNFTMTESSLKKQCLNLYLKHKEPTIYESSELTTRLQGEFRLRIKELEEDLLTKISEQSGSILDNEALIATLDNLKVSADEVQAKIATANETMQQIKPIVSKYKALARVTAQAYFALQAFGTLNVLYQFSFEMFMEVLSKILGGDSSSNDSIELLQQQLFINLYVRVEPNILEKDKRLLALRFAQLNSDQSTREYFDLISSISVREHDKMNSGEFGDRRTLIVKKMITEMAVRPTKAMEAVTEVINAFLSHECTVERLIDLKEEVERNSSGSTPILMSTAPGFDPTDRIEALAKTLQRKMETVAIGSSEGFMAAEKAMERGLREGNWVVLKNVHLACFWLSELEEKMGTWKPHVNYRLFLISEFSEHVPKSLARKSTKLIFELPSGIKYNVKRMLTTSVDTAKMDSSTVRSRLYYQAVWLHAVIMERLRYVPIGWSKQYEFSEADLKCALEVIDNSMTPQATTTNIVHNFKHLVKSNKDQFVALRHILTHNVYGGKIDNEFDLKVLKAIVDQFMDESFFDGKRNYVDSAALNFAATSHKACIDYISSIEAVETPEWAGLPVSAKDVLLGNMMREFNSKWRLMQSSSGDEMEYVNAAMPSNIEDIARLFTSLHPESMDESKNNHKEKANSLWRFTERERATFVKLFSDIKRDLDNCSAGKAKKLAKTLESNRTPESWMVYASNEVNVTKWIRDLRSRVEQLRWMGKTNDWQLKGFKLGLTLFPEAFLTASRQFVADLREVALDELELEMEFDDGKEVAGDSFIVDELTMEGVNLSAKGLSVENEMSYRLERVKFTWSRVDEKSNDCVQIPMYLNRERKRLIASIRYRMKCDEGTLYQRGIAIIAKND